MYKDPDSIKDAPAAILFDFDGTLADSFEATLTIGNQLAEKYGYRPLNRTEAIEFRRRGIRRILQESDLPLHKVPLWLREFRKNLHAAVPEMKPCAGIQETLQKLRTTDVPLGIVTSNSRENVELFLDNNGWSNWFSWLECGSGLFGKHRLIERLLRKNNLAPEDVLYVGDEERDIDCAQTAGVRSVAVTWGFNTREVLSAATPDHLCENPTDLLKLVL